MKNIGLFLFLLSFVIISCKPNSKNTVTEDNTVTHYTHNNVSFTLPKNWTVEKQKEQTDDYFVLNKYENYKIQGTLAITIYPEKQVTDSVFSSQIRQLKLYYSPVTFKVDEAKKAVKLGKFESEMKSYFADDTKQKAYGKLFVIQQDKKTICVQLIEMKENSLTNDYNEIFSSLEIK